MHNKNQVMYKSSEYKKVPPQPVNKVFDISDILANDDLDELLDGVNEFELLDLSTLSTEDNVNEIGTLSEINEAYSSKAFLTEKKLTQPNELSEVSYTDDDLNEIKLLESTKGVELKDIFTDDDLNEQVVLEEIDGAYSSKTFFEEKKNQQPSEISKISTLPKQVTLDENQALLLKVMEGNIIKNNGLLNKMKHLIIKNQEFLIQQQAARDKMMRPQILPQGSISDFDVNLKTSQNDPNKRAFIESRRDTGFNTHLEYYINSRYQNNEDQFHSNNRQGEYRPSSVKDLELLSQQRATRNEIIQSPVLFQPSTADTDVSMRTSQDNSNKKSEFVGIHGFASLDTRSENNANDMSQMTQNQFYNNQIQEKYDTRSAKNRESIDQSTFMSAEGLISLDLRRFTKKDKIAHNKKLSHATRGKMKPIKPLTKDDKEFLRSCNLTRDERFAHNKRANNLIRFNRGEPEIPLTDEEKKLLRSYDNKRNLKKKLMKRL